MGNHQQIDRIRAERLLDDTDGGTGSVGRLLAAARGPVRPDELRREAEAVGAFLAAVVAAPPRRHVTVAGRRLWPQLVGVKLAGLAFAVALTGVALAAGTGVLPNPLDAVPTSAAPPTPDSPLSSNADWPSPSSSHSSSSPQSSSSPDSSPSHSSSSSPGADHASLVGLCRAYEARGDRDPGAAMGSAAFAGLVAAAGGPDQVAAFCAELLAAEESTGNGNNGSSGNGNGSATTNGVATPTDAGGGQSTDQ